MGNDNPTDNRSAIDTSDSSTEGTSEDLSPEIDITKKANVEYRSNRSSEPSDTQARIDWGQILKGTYGKDGQLTIWAKNNKAGIRVVRLQLIIDDVIASVCAYSSNWHHTATTDYVLDGKQFEICSPRRDGPLAYRGHVVAYYGQDWILIAIVNGDEYDALVRSDYNPNFETKSNFC